MPDAAPRVALIGVSGYARVHLRFLEELADNGKIGLAAVTVVNRTEEAAVVERLQARGCPVYGNYESMLATHAGDIELCCIPTGIPLHRPMTVAALMAGANVLVEKPLAPTLAEVRAIQAAEQASGRWVAVGFQDLYAEENRMLKRLLADGIIGRLRRISVRGLWPRDSGYYQRNNWAGHVRQQGEPVYDSPLSNAFSHFLNLALYFAGPSVSRSAEPIGVEGSLWRAQTIQNFDTAAVRIRTGGDVEILAFVSHSSESTLEPEIAIDGEQGTVEWQSGRHFRITPPRNAPAVTQLPDPDALRRVMFRHVVGRLRDPMRPICGTAIAAEHVKACEMVQRLPVSLVTDGAVTWRQTPDGGRHAVITRLEEAFGSAWTGRRLPPESALTPMGTL